MGRGAEGVHIVSVVKAFEKLGHQVTVISPPGIDPLNQTVQNPLDKTNEKTKGINSVWKSISKRAPQIFFEFFEIAYNFIAIWNIHKALKDRRFDFIYERAAYFMFAGAFISWVYGIPLVIEANEVVGIKRARRLIMKPFALILEKLSFRKAVSIFTVSSYLKDRIIKSLGDFQDKVYVTPNAISPEDYRRQTKRIEIRDALGLTDKIVLGFAGWFDWWDRLDLLIDIQYDIKKMGINHVSTLIIGDGPMTGELKGKTRVLELENHVVFTGAVARNDVMDYIDSFDIGVFAHSNEFGSPVVLFEMMGLGKAIVAPELKPITDVITHGYNGIVFPVLDKSALLDGVLSIINNPERILQIGIAAKDTVFKLHSWEGNALKIIKSVKD